MKRLPIDNQETGYVYALTEPGTEKVRYIGQSLDPNKRYWEHINSGTSPVNARRTWIHGLLQIGKQPGIVLLQTVPANDRFAAEKRWIAHYEKQGADLLNFHNYSTDPAFTHKGVIIRKEWATAIHREAINAETTDTIILDTALQSYFTRKGR